MDFPEFIRNEKNAIDPRFQTEGNIGYLFEGNDNVQIAFWTSQKDITSKESSHSFDEYLVVVDGSITLFVEDKELSLKKGDEYLIHKGIKHYEIIKKGARVIYAFGGKRAQTVKI